MLGYNYDVIKDVLKLNDKIKQILKERYWLKLLWLLIHFHYVLPVTVRGKLLLRDLREMKLGWDDIKPPDKVKDWRNLASC